MSDWLRPHLARANVGVIKKAARLPTTRSDYGSGIGRAGCAKLVAARL
jgi:hypothetical protein